MSKMFSNGEFYGVFVGTIEEVLPPGSNGNISGYQYEYQVAINTEKYSRLVAKCIKMDYSGGSESNFEDEILESNSRVFVEFPNGDVSMGIIIGGSRSYPLAQPDEGILWRKRFNLVDQTIDNDGVYSVGIRPIVEGPIGTHITMDESSVTIGDGKELPTQDSIIVDQASQTITVTCGTWEVKALKEANITVIGDVTVKCKNLNATVLGDASLKAKSLDVTALGEINIKSAQGINMDSLQISMNKGAGNVITTLTTPSCYITGIPFVGSPTVRAT